MKRTVEELIDKINKNNDYIIFLYRWLYDCNLSWDESEKMCEYLLDNIDELTKHIPMLTYAGKDQKKEKDYRIDSRDGFTSNPQKDMIYEKTGKHRRAENYLAMEIFRMGRPQGDLKNPNKIDQLGYILDYEMPIGGTNTLLTMNIGDKCLFDLEKNGYEYGILDPDKKADKEEDRLFTPGKCDLIAYDNKQFTILELKTKDNEEPILRAVMEAYTYLHLLNKEKASDSFRKYYPCLNIPDFKQLVWKAAPLLNKDGTQFEEYNKNNNSNLRKLLEKLKIYPIWYISDFSIIL